MYSGYGITFHGKSTWQFGNELAKDVVIFGVVVIFVSYATYFIGRTVAY